MALILRDRIRETSTTTGTATFALGGAVLGFRSFGAVMAAFDTTFYTITNPGTNEWEVGVGTYISPNQLSRTQVYASSLSPFGGTLVNFSAGTKDVFMTYAASQAVTLAYLASFSTGIVRITNGLGISTLDPASGMLAWNTSTDNFLSRSIAAGTGITVTNGNGVGGNPTVFNAGIVELNQRTNTSNISLWWHRTVYSTYGEFWGASPWLNNINQGTFFFKQIGGGFNNTDTPDNFFWDKNSDISSDSNYPQFGYPRASTDRNNFLRRYYYYTNRWYQREMIYMGEANWVNNPRAIRSLSELVVGSNWLEGDDTPDKGYTYAYLIPFSGSATQVPTGTSVTGNFLISGTTASPTILSQAVLTTTEVRVHMNGRSFVFTAWTADGSVSIKYEGGGYGEYFNTITFGANTTFYYNYWCEGDITARTFVKVLFNNTAAANWSYAAQSGDKGDTIWRAYIQSANRGNYNGGFWRDPDGFVFTSNRIERIWSNKSIALPLTTNAVARPFTIQCRFRVDNITTINQNVFWVANSAAPANPNGIRVIINEGTVDRRLSITLGTTANATTTGNIVDKLRVWQFNGVNEWIIVTFVWNPLDTVWPGRLYVNGAMMFKTVSQPFSATTVWHNIGSTVDGTANGFEGRVDYLQIVPECWGAYMPQGTALIDVDAGDAAWINANNNGGQDVPMSCRNNFGFRGYLRGSSWGVGANIRVDNNEYFDGPIVGSAADSFTLTGDIVNGSATVTLSKTTAGFSRNTGRFLVTATGIPTTTNVYCYVQYGDKTFDMYDRNGLRAATATTNGVTITFVRCNGSTATGGYLQMPDNAIFVAKSNNISGTLTNELAGVNSGATTATCAFPNITFTTTADATINDYYTTQNSVANNTAVRALQAALALGPKQYTVSGQGLLPTSATVDNARVVGIAWDGLGTGLHQVFLSRNRDAAAGGGVTVTAVFVPSNSSGYNDFDLLGGDNARDTGNGETDGYSVDDWWFSSQRNMKTMMATAGIGQWRYTRVSPPGCVYDSGVFRATTTTFARNMYLGYGCIGYLITYGTTGDYNQSTVNPVVSTIAWAATNGMNSDGFSLTVVTNTFYRIVILPFGTTLTGDYVQ